MGVCICPSYFSNSLADLIEFNQEALELQCPLCKMTTEAQNWTVIPQDPVSLEEEPGVSPASVVLASILLLVKWTRRMEESGGHGTVARMEEGRDL